MPESCLTIFLCLSNKEIQQQWFEAKENPFVIINQLNTNNLSVESWTKQWSKVCHLLQNVMLSKNLMWQNSFCLFVIQIPRLNLLNYENKLVPCWWQLIVGTGIIIVKPRVCWRAIFNKIFLHCHKIFLSDINCSCSNSFLWESIAYYSIDINLHVQLNNSITDALELTLHK